MSETAARLEAEEPKAYWIVRCAKCGGIDGAFVERARTAPERLEEWKEFGAIERTTERPDPADWCECSYLRHAEALESGPPVEAQEPTYPCKDCGKPRTKAEGGTTFTVCDECWDKFHKPKRELHSAPDYQADVRAFHEALVPDQVAERPTMPPDRVINLRLDLIEEEFSELWAALRRGDLVAVADALTDLLYVTYGTAVACGIEIAPIWREVHRSNMAKDGGPTRADGKLLKPEGWTPPDVRGELERQGWSDDGRGGEPPNGEGDDE